MDIKKTTLPLSSSLVNVSKPYDYVDSFQGTLLDKLARCEITDVGKAFFTSAPTWVGQLLILRDKLVGVFGLKTSDLKSDREQQLNNFNCEPGEQLGLFKVFSKTSEEVVLGADDKHLNFRVSLFLNPVMNAEKQLTISTVVTLNNWFGKLYFLPVKFFHKIIVPIMLKNMIKQLTLKNSQ